MKNMGRCLQAVDNIVVDEKLYKTGVGIVRVAGTR